MKIEIDLQQLLGDEYGDQETIAESIQRQIVENLSKGAQQQINKAITEETNRVLNEKLQEALKAHMPALLDDLMNYEYTPVSGYGEKSKPTSFKQQLVAAVAKECTYNPRTYSSEENAFTKGFKAIVEEQMKAFKKEWDVKINEQFRKDCLTYAVTELSKRLGLPK